MLISLIIFLISLYIFGGRTKKSKRNMSNIDNILAFNQQFVASKGYERHITNKYPDKKLAILSCMDTRLSVLLPEAQRYAASSLPFMS